MSRFPYHGPLEPEQVHGRDDLIAEITEQVTNRRPTVLVAPRRYGKTSLLRRIEADLGDTATIVHVDLYELRSWADLAARFDAALAHVPGPGGQTLHRLAASVDINLGIVKATVTSPAERPPDTTVDQLLDVLVRHAATSPTVLVFDEFSSISRVDGATGLLRTKLQHHFQQIGLLFAGSEPSTMRLLFEGTDQPFYAQADMIFVPPLSLDAFTDIVAAGFDETPPPRLAAQIHAFTHGHPQRSMQLADAAWNTYNSGHADPWPIALARIQETTGPGHETRFSAASAPDQAVLRLIAQRSPLYGKQAQRLNLSYSSTQLSVERLADAGLISQVDDEWRVVDPLYGDWIARRFPL